MYSKKSTRFTGTVGVWATGLGVGVAIVAVLLAARQPQPKKAAAAAVKALAPDASARTLAVDATAPKALAQQPAPVTITGCLERNDETFRLKDTSGTDAPKSRSWKSGFLKKGAGSIDVVDAANRLRLPNYVGQRVSVTGMLVDREMQVRSLQRVAESCTKS